MRVLATACLATLWLLPGTLMAGALEDVIALREQAETGNALQLAPEAYARGVRALDQARELRAQGRDAARVDARLAESRAAFDQAIAHLEKARPVFAETLAQRLSAQEAQAFRFAGERWAAAERAFLDAATRFERDPGARAAERAADITALYADAQLSANRTQFLSGARAMLAEAEQLRAARQAPLTLERARQRMAAAEQALADNRNEPEAATSDIQDAIHAAGHALQMARIAEAVRRREQTLEELVLELEGAMARIVAAAGLQADFSRPHGETSRELATELAAMRASAAETRSELAERTRFVLNLEDEIKELQQRLGATGADRDRLMMTLQAQERVREQFAQVESLFEPGEARILREGGRLIIRLTGIGFPSGSAQVPQNAQPLLGRLSRAISVFPGARLLVEGHTDATGSDQINQRLSEERARAVADWLVGELRLAPGQVPAAGYGASRPVANNATEAGRAQNRRIDVIITPDLPAGLP